MHLEDFPFCCTAKIMVGFGESQIAEREWIGDGHQPKTVAEYHKVFDEYVENLKRQGLAMLCCTTNNKQPIVNKALMEYGFGYTYWMTKKEHRTTKIRFWWLPIKGEVEED